MVYFGYIVARSGQVKPNSHIEQERERRQYETSDLQESRPSPEEIRKFEIKSIRNNNNKKKKND